MNALCMGVLRLSHSLRHRFVSGAIRPLPTMAMFVQQYAKMSGE